MNNCTVFLPIQSNHLNSLLPKDSRIKVITSHSSKTRVHSHQMSQIVLLDLMVCVWIFDKFFDLGLGKAEDVVEKLAIGVFEGMPFVCFCVNCHVAESGDNFGRFARSTWA